MAKRLEPGAVYAAACATGSAAGSARLLGCTRAYLYLRDDLRQSLNAGVKVWRAARRSTVVDALRLPATDARALAAAAREAGEDLQTLLGRYLAGLPSLPNTAAPWARDDIVVRVRVPAEWQAAMRALHGTEYAGRVRAALLALARNVQDF